ncbi:MAG TPA: hypothetical protein VKB51_00675 [bacterium]|nr:hypothetical protein [bacterium]
MMCWKHRSRRVAAVHRSALLAPLGALLALSVLAPALGACSAERTSQGTGGLPALEAARVSLVVAQTRAQFPDLSGTAIPYEPRKPPEKVAGTEPELALRGAAVGVQPGLQTGDKPKAQVALYLDKQAYARGYLELAPAGGKPQRFRIVAYDQRGGPRKDFDFMYVLATPGEQVRYLALIGGRYTQDGEDYLGYEGTLIEPGAGNDLEHWQRAWQIDFGYRLPFVPTHERKVDQAVDLFRQIQRDMDRLESLRGRITEDEAELKTQSAKQPPANETSDQAALRTQRLTNLQSRLDALRVERDGLIETAEGRFVKYYGLRKAISEEYVAFTQSNRYLWLDAQGRQDFYDKWKVVEYHHPRIDNMVATFLTFRDHDAKVMDARAAAMAVITKNDNWARDPSKSGKSRPR